MSANMNVVLINPPFGQYGGLEGHGGKQVPIGLLCLAAYARQQHPDLGFRIVDSDGRGLSHQETVEQVMEDPPILIAITANTCVFDSVISLVAELKKNLPDTPIIIGGHHPSALPEQSLLESNADLTSFGEGELTFDEVITEIRNGARDWSKIDGIVYRDENGVPVRNKVRALIEDLDILPFPARDLIDNELYYPAPTKRVRGGPNTMLVSSRGCPYNCGFCSAATIWTRSIRSRSAENLVAEVKECIDLYGIRSFNFTDELFTVKKKRVLGICEAIIDTKLDISWVCSARAHHLDSETLEAMKAAGCREISFGIESGNEEILQKIDKVLKLDEARRVIQLTKKAGIKTHASYIMGYLGETEETLKDTIRFAKELNTTIAAFFVASPLPGTPFYHEAMQKGYIRDDITWINFSPLTNQESVVNLPGLSRRTIRRLHRKAIKEYYLRPRYILARLFSIRHWYEVENLFNGAKLLLNIKA
jgi:radical SAM superfamily enzyme YgiQ (UPF0313 family)